MDFLQLLSVLILRLVVDWYYTQKQSDVAAPYTKDIEGNPDHMVRNVRAAQFAYCMVLLHQTAWIISLCNRRKQWQPHSPINMHGETLATQLVFSCNQCYISYGIMIIGWVSFLIWECRTRSEQSERVWKWRDLPESHFRSNDFTKSPDMVQSFSMTKANKLDVWKDLLLTSIKYLNYRVQPNATLHLNSLQIPMVIPWKVRRKRQCYYKP